MAFPLRFVGKLDGKLQFYPPDFSAVEEVKRTAS